MIYIYIYVDNFYGIKQLFILQTLYRRIPSVLLLIYVEYVSDTLLYSYAGTDKSRLNSQGFLNLRFRQSNPRLETVTFYKPQLLTHKVYVNIL